MNKLLFWLEKHLAVIYVKLLGSSLKYILRTPKPTEKVIYAFWHRNMIPLFYLHRYQDIVILISSSKDGELIAAPAELLGYQTARGSSRRGGSSASRELIKKAKDHYLAITPDGPKGPAEKIKDGVIYISYLSGTPIVPVAVDVEKEKVFNSWDKFRLPHFFSRINVTYGQKIMVNKKEEIQEKQQFLQMELDRLTEENKIRNIERN